MMDHAFLGFLDPPDAVVFGVPFAGGVGAKAISSAFEVLQRHAPVSAVAVT